MAELKEGMTRLELQRAIFKPDAWTIRPCTFGEFNPFLYQVNTQEDDDLLKTWEIIDSL